MCGIVKKQLALSADTEVSGESKFAALGADSLDTVCSSALRQFVARHSCVSVLSAIMVRTIN